MSPQQMWHSVRQAQQTGGEQATVQLTHELLRKHGLKAVMDTLVHGLREFSSLWDEAMDAAERSMLDQDTASHAQALAAIERARKR